MLIGTVPLAIACLVAANAAAPVEKVFPPDAVVDVTRAPYHAVPDDGKDDTAALQQAITDNVDTGRVLYLPAGTYIVSDTLNARDKEGRWRCHLTLQGQNRDTTILRLKDSAKGFTDPESPKPVLRTASFWEEGDANDGGGNKAFRNNVLDLTIDTGSGNAGAIGIDWAVSNQGSIRDVAIRSGDGTGRAGIAMPRKIPGPGLIKNVTISGYDVGVDAGDIQYGFTLENVHVEDQRTAGIRTTMNLLHIHKLTSRNRVPAIIVSDPQGVLTLVHAELTGGDPRVPAIDAAGTTFLRDVRLGGYEGVRLRGKDIAAPLPAEVIAPERADALTTFEPLPVPPIPEFWNADLDDWAAVGPRREGETDDTQAIQRAFDSGKRTVYFPNDRTYFLSDTVVVREPVRQVLGQGAEISLGAAREPFSDRANPRPLFRIAAQSTDSIHFENLFFNAQYPGEVLFENDSPAPVVIRRSMGWVGNDGSRRTYRNTPRATGPLFLEDVFLPGWEFRNQDVWARQFNPENWDGTGAEPQVHNRGGRLWVLGFKTEGPAPFLATSDGGVTELLGAYNYISATKADPVPQGSVPYPVDKARASLTFTGENFREIGYPHTVRFIDGDETIDWEAAPEWPRNGHQGHHSYAVPVVRFPQASN